MPTNVDRPPFPITIVHISDLHFGAEDGRKIEAFQENLKDTKPDLICITGDIVDAPWKRNFDKARQFINDLKQKAPVHFVPGNHDAFFGGPAIRRFKRHLLGGADIDFARHENIRGVDLYIFGVNSTYPTLRHLWNTGYVTPTRLTRLREQVATIKRNDGESRFRNAFKIVLLHHHPLPTLSSEFERMLYLKQSGQFLSEMVKLDANLILHGHQHDPFDFSINYNVGGESDSMVVLAAGTAFKEMAEQGVSKQSHYYNVHLNGIVVNGQEPVGYVTNFYVEGMNYDTSGKRFVHNKGFGKIVAADPYAAYEARVKYIVNESGDLRKEETRQFRAKPGYEINEILLSIGVDEQTPGLDGTEQCKCKVTRQGVPVDSGFITMKKNDRREKEFAIRLDPPSGGRDEKVTSTLEWPGGWNRLIQDGADTVGHSITRRIDKLTIEIENGYPYFEMETEAVYEGKIEATVAPRSFKWEIENPAKYKNVWILVRKRQL